MRTNPNQNYSSETFDFSDVSCMIDYLREEGWDDADIMGLLHRNRVDTAKNTFAVGVCSYVYTWGLSEWGSSLREHQMTVWFNVQKWWEGK